MKKPVLLFDWDGTIIDSNAWKWGGAWQKAFAGEPALVEFAEIVLAEDKDKKLSRGQIVDEVLRRATARGVAPLSNNGAYLERFGDAVRSGTVKKGLFPGAEKTLRLLSMAGYRMYVISATAQEDLDYAAKTLGASDYFISLYGRPGEKSEHAETIRAQESAETQFVVIGDGESDRELAEYLHTPFVGVMNEWNGWKNTQPPFHTIRDIIELPTTLKLL